MAMDSFSWSDSIQAAFSSCLPCLRPSTPSVSDEDAIENETANRVRRARPDELEGLLADTDTEAETLSLHSNLGVERRRKKRRGLPKRITLFGWNLFGKPAIYLPEEDDDEVLSGRRRRVPGAISSSTLDSDAAPLDSSAIEGMTSSQLEERALVAEAEERRQKEDRKRRKRERKELKLAANALALNGVGESFEGFQGSGHAYSIIPSPFQDSPSPAPSRVDEFGPFITGVVEDADADADADAADLGGELYTRKATSGNSNDSDSRSRTSASQSSRDVHYNHHYISQQVPPHMALPPSSGGYSDSSSSAAPLGRKKSSKSKSYKKSSSSTSQSSSLPSPVQTQMPFMNSPAVASPYSTSSDSARERLQPGAFEGHPQDSNNNYGFPSVGLGGARTKNRDMGAFLAHRGDV